MSAFPPVPTISATSQQRAQQAQQQPLPRQAVTRPAPANQPYVPASQAASLAPTVVAPRGGNVYMVPRTSAFAPQPAISSQPRVFSQAQAQAYPASPSQEPPHESLAAQEQFGLAAGAGSFAPIAPLGVASGITQPAAVGDAAVAGATAGVQVGTWAKLKQKWPIIAAFAILVSVVAATWQTWVPVLAACVLCPYLAPVGFGALVALLGYATYKVYQSGKKDEAAAQQAAAQAAAQAQESATQALVAQRSTELEQQVAALTGAVAALQQWAADAEVVTPEPTEAPAQQLQGQDGDDEEDYQFGGQPSAAHVAAASDVLHQLASRRVASAEQTVAAQ